MCTVSGLVVCNIVDEVDPYANEEGVRQEYKAQDKSLIWLIEKKHAKKKRKQNTERSILENFVAENMKVTKITKNTQILGIQGNSELSQNPKRQEY